MCNYCLLYLEQSRWLPAVFDVVWEYKQKKNPVALVSSNWYMLQDIPKHLYMQKTTLLLHNHYFFCETFYHWSNNEYLKIKLIFFPCLLLRKCCDFAFRCVYFHITNLTVNFFHYAVLTWRSIKRNPCEWLLASHGITIPRCMLFASTGA